jgi:glycosyltransferase involved in cell wall biosynthesis
MRDGPGIRLLFHGHDFKFARLLIDHFASVPGWSVIEHEADPQDQSSRAKRRDLMAWADVVFCEWALANARWTSRHKRPGQVLVIRVHRYELQRSIFDEIAWDAVDAVVFIAPELMDTFLRRVPAMASRAHLIHNLVDCDALDRPKEGDAPTTLGLLGAAPRRKAPHLALDILERARDRDARVRLRIKGRHPWEYRWLWDDPAERAYYERLYDRIGRMEDGLVSFDPFGKDVSGWLQHIGVIVSTSEQEGSHQAVAEGMAAGSVPVILPWPGADRLYPPRFIAPTTDAAAEMVVAVASGRSHDEEAACRAYAREHFDRRVIVPRYEELFRSLLGEARAGAPDRRRRPWRRLMRLAGR